MTDEAVGQSTEWVGDYKFRLAPILCIEMAQLASDDDYRQNARDVLEYWIEIENRNLTRVRAGLYGWEMPDSYEINVLPGASGRSSQWLARPSKELLNIGLRHLSECLEFLGRQLHDTGNSVAAVEAALLYRYLHEHFALFPEERTSGARLTHVFIALNESLAKKNYLFAGVDELQRILENTLSKKAPNSV